MNKNYLKRAQNLNDNRYGYATKKEDKDGNIEFYPDGGKPYCIKLTKNEIRWLEEDKK